MIENENTVKKYVSVTDAPFNAKGDGVTNDRESIQKAIDTVYNDGGGTVFLPSGKVFLSSGIVIRSNVTLMFGDGAQLKQTSKQNEYVKPCGDKYIPYKPEYGHNYSETIKWSHYWYKNYPFIFAPEGSHDFAIKGNGVIRMMDVDDVEKIIKICPIGFYRCSHFEICDVHITNYHGYAVMPFTSSYGLFKNIKITDWSYGNGDGICLMNCQNIRVTGCEMFTGDDSVYIFSSCCDPRKSEWWSSDEPQPSINIEIDNNDLKSNHCKAFGMILWGLNCPDLEKVEVRNVYVHDNHFETMGNWLYCPYTDKAGYPPVTNVRFENNVIDGIEANFFETQISDMNYYHSMSQMRNGNFEHGRCFWSFKNTAGVKRSSDGNEESYGYIEISEDGNSAVYQGIYIKSEYPCLFKADVMSSGDVCRMFVKNLDTGELVSSLDFSNTDWEEKTLNFKVPKDGNYHIGIESGEAKKGFARIKGAVLGSHESSFGFKDVIFDRGKVIFKYNDNLFKR